MKLPKEFESRMEKMLGKEYPCFKDAFVSGKPASGIRLNTAKCGKIPDIFSSLKPIPWCSYGFYADKEDISGKHPYHFAGLFYFQEPSAMAVVSALGIKKGDYVLDLCAAPGGKATQAGALLDGSGLLVANEINSKRAVILAENTERFGLKNTVVTNESPDSLAEKFAEFFDKIIVDAPCSGEGMFRKEPQAVDCWSEQHTFSCALRQQNIIDSALKMLKSGGRLIYSTCTFAPCENEGICDYILKKYPDMRLEKIYLNGLSNADGRLVNSSFDLSGAKRVYPHRQRGEGHFLALFAKNGNTSRKLFAAKKPDKKTAEALKMFRDFEKKALNTSFDGDFKLFGENLYYLPFALPLDGIKTIRAGLHLGTVKKGRFEPAHALALALKAEDFKNSVNFPCESDEIKKYLHGEALSGNSDGHGALLTDGYPLGWVKGSGGILKNKFPKNLRI